MAKKGTKQKKYSTEFKIGVIVDMRENHLSYGETVRRHWDVESKAECANYRLRILTHGVNVISLTPKFAVSVREFHVTEFLKYQ